MRDWVGYKGTLVEVAYRGKTVLFNPDLAHCSFFVFIGNNENHKKSESSNKSPWTDLLVAVSGLP